MVIDDGGAIWLSNPWLVAVVVTFAIGLVLWCHRWLETGAAPAPRNLSVRTLRMAQRRPITHDSSAPAPIRQVVRTRATSVGARRGSSSARPSNAA
jgi:hypothetical protein